MGAIKNIRYDCRHATYLIEKGQHTPLTIKERIKLHIHLYGCSVCRLFKKQSSWINSMIKGMTDSAEGRENKLDDEFKRRLQDKINERLK